MRCEYVRRILLRVEGKRFQAASRMSKGHGVEHAQQVTVNV